MDKSSRVKATENLESADLALENVSPSLVKKINKEDTVKLQQATIVIYGVLVLLGVGTGYLLSRTSLAGPKTASDGVRVGGIVKTEKVVGVADEKTFKDSAEGVIQSGGTDGEGSHSLIRAGGPSQTASLISSVVDLDEYVGKKVKVWGQTVAAQKAAWLMDVGKIEILE